VTAQPLAAAVALAVAALAFLGWNEVGLLFAAAVAVPLLRLPAAGHRLLAVEPVSLVMLTLIFLKVGSILFGSGYVLLAFLRPDLVTRTGWLGDRELLDAIAVGQVTPGPVLTTATFIGYLLAGVPGALLATFGIFFPSFVFVAISSPLIPRMRRSPWAAGFLDGANAASVALMAVVTWQLGRAAIVDWLTAALAAGAGLSLLFFRWNSAWLVAAGAVVGLVVAFLR